MAIPLKSRLGKEVLIIGRQTRPTVNESRPKWVSDMLYWRTREGREVMVLSPDCGSLPSPAQGGENMGAGGSAPSQVPLVLKKYPQTYTSPLKRELTHRVPEPLTTV